MCIVRDHYWAIIMNQHLCFWCINVEGVPNKFPFKANAHLQLLLVNLSITCTWVQNGCFTPLNWTLILGFKWLTQQNRFTPSDRATLIYFIYNQLLGKWPAESKVSPFIGAMSAKRPSRFHVVSIVYHVMTLRQNSNDFIRIHFDIHHVLH
jgi:hypothetical protein